MNKKKVIAISGISGAGKTTIVNQLASAFDCPKLFFDDFIDDDSYPVDMKHWLSLGADFNAIKTPKFHQSLAKLRQHSRARYIFIEEPFGKAREAMSTLIDHVVLLDTPKEISLARIIKRRLAHENFTDLNGLVNYLTRYEDHLAAVYAVSAAQVRPHADLVLTGALSVNEVTQFIRHWLVHDTVSLNE